VNNTDDNIKKVILICKHYIKTKELSVQWNTFKKGKTRNGAPTSSLISEIFLQYTEHTKIINIVIIQLYIFLNVLFKFQEPEDDLF
jgi:hypothetical protein